MRIGKLTYCIVASVTCAVVSVLYALDAVREFNHDAEWDKAVQAELTETVKSDGLQEGQHIPDTE